MAASLLRILGRPNSFNVRKILWLCDEIEIPYTREDWGRGFKPTTSPEFLGLNPVAQIPVVLDGDLVLRESNAIMRYLCQKHGAERLYPSPPERRARVEQWMDWVAYVWLAVHGTVSRSQTNRPHNMGSLHRQWPRAYRAGCGQVG